MIVDPKVRHWSRGVDDNWSHVILDGLDAVIQVAEPLIVLDLLAMYEGLTFRPRPRLVLEGNAEPP